MPRYRDLDKRLAAIDQAVGSPRTPATPALLGRRHAKAMLTRLWRWRCDRGPGNTTDRELVKALGDAAELGDHEALVLLKWLRKEGGR